MTKQTGCRRFGALLLDIGVFSAEQEKNPSFPHISSILRMPQSSCLLEIYSMVLCHRTNYFLLKKTKTSTQRQNLVLIIYLYR